MQNHLRGKCWKKVVHVLLQIVLKIVGSGDKTDALKTSCSEAVRTQLKFNS